MKSITFSCSAKINLTPEALADLILSPDAWSQFDGYGIVPGIKSAAFDVRTPEVIGSRIRVENRDGSRHVEEIVAWQPGAKIGLRMSEFSPPLSLLASAIDETWLIAPAAGGSSVVREFDLHARSPFSWPALWLIARLLKRAIARQLEMMRSE